MSRMLMHCLPQRRQLSLDFAPECPADAGEVQPCQVTIADMAEVQPGFTFLVLYQQFVDRVAFCQQLSEEHFGSGRLAAARRTAEKYRPMRSQDIARLAKSPGINETLGEPAQVVRRLLPR